MKKHKLRLYIFTVSVEDLIDERCQTFCACVCGYVSNYKQTIGVSLVKTNVKFKGLKGNMKNIVS